MGCLKITENTGVRQIDENHFFLGDTYAKKEVPLKNCDDYLPFGLSFNSYSRAAITAQNFKFNAGSELEEMTDWYSTPFRKYDPSLGRFHGVDALADLAPGITPGHFAYNNPIMTNDPSGLKPPENEAPEDEDDPGQSGDSGGDPFAWMRSSEFSMHGYSNIASANKGHGGQNGWASAIAGSGNHWSDGTGFSDWSLSGGSDTFREGLAMGLTYLGGDLYRINNDGSRDLYGESNGQVGFWENYYRVDYATEKLGGKIWVGATVVIGNRFTENSLWNRLMARVNQDIMIMTDGPGGPDTSLRKSDGSQARLLNISELLPAGTTRSSKRSTGNTKMQNAHKGTKSLMTALKALVGISYPSNEPDSIFGGEGLSPSGYGRFIILTGEDSVITIYGEDSVKTKLRKSGL